MKYHVKGPIGSQETFIRGFKNAFDIASQNSNKAMLIRVGFLNELDGIMSDVLGTQLVKNLRKDKMCKLEGMTIYLEGDKTRSKKFKKGVVFCPWASRSKLNEIEQDYRATDIIYVPWNTDGLNDYLKANPDSIEL